MARLWTSGFELRSAAAGMEIDTVTGTAPTISTTTFRGGSAAIRFNPTAAASYVTHRFAANAIRSQFARVAFRFASFPAADVDIFQWFDGTNGFPSVRFFAATSKLQCRDGAAGLIGSASATLSLNTWYVLQVAYNDTTGDTVNAYLDGAQFCTNGAGGDVGGLGQVRFGLLTTSTADLFMDDIAVNDSTGTADTGLPDRTAQVTILHVTAAGDNNLFPTATGGTAGTANNFTRVSETTPDDGTTHNGLAATGTTQIDDFNVTDASAAGVGASDTVAHVAVGIRVGSTATTTASVVARLKGQASGTVSESASISVAVNGWRTGGVVAAGSPQVSSNITAYVNPQGSVAWTPSALDNVQVGYRANVSQTSVRRVTKVWALVEHVPNPSTPANVTPTTIVGLVAVTGTAQAGSTPVPATIAGTTTISGTAQLSAAVSPATVLGAVSISGTAQAGSAPAPATIAPPAVVISATAQTGSTAVPGTIAPTKAAISGTAQAGAVAVPATIAPPKVAISGTAQVGSTVAATTIAPPVVVISGTAETSSTSTVPASTIAPPKVAISGTAQTGSTAVPSTIAPPAVTISGAAQSSRTAAPATIAGITAVSGTAQAGAAPSVATIAPPKVVVTSTAQAGSAPAPATILGTTSISGTANTGAAPAPATIAPPVVAISGSAQTASGVTVAASTIAGSTTITGAAGSSQAASAGTIAGTTSISGTAVVGSTARPVTIAGSIEIGPHTASGSSGAVPQAATIGGTVVITGTGRAGSRALPATILGAVAFPAVAVVRPAGGGTIAGAVTIGPHLIVQTGAALVATIAGVLAMAGVRLTAGEVTPGAPVVTGDALAARVTSGTLTTEVTGDDVRARATGVTLTAGVS